MRHSGLALALAFAFLGFGPAPAGAQTSPDFLFGSPNGMIGVRSGWVFASANSDLFTFVQEHLTVDRKDFNAPAIGVDVEFAVAPRVGVIGGFDYARTSKDSEYRDFVDNQRLPITQTTQLSELNLSGSVKFAVTPRGREISNRAWIPAAVTPYVGAGGGVIGTSSCSTATSSTSTARPWISSPTRFARPAGHRLPTSSAASTCAYTSVCI